MRNFLYLILRIWF